MTYLDRQRKARYYYNVRYAIVRKGDNMANITNRNGKFLIRVFTGRDISGKQIVKSTTYVPPEGTSPKKAEKLAQEYAFEFERHCKGYAQLNENMRFSELAEWYFENYAPEELKPTTVLNYESQYRNHIAPILGNKKLKDITTPMLTEFLKVLGKEHHLNPISVRKVYIVVQSIYRRALQQGFARDNPCQNVIIPKKRDSGKRYSLSEEETKRFLHLIRDKPWDEDVKRILIVLLFTGMRIGECLGLAWEDIDFEKKTIFIHHTLSCVDGECYLDSPKTKSSIRLIAMNSTVEKCLRDQQAYVGELKTALGNKYAHPEMVFPSGLGNYRDRCSVYHSLKRMTKGTEFEDMTLHKLRHCNATLLLNSGVDLKVISEHLGHCDIGVTANIYADVLQKQKIRLADTIDDKLSDELT